MTWRDVWLNVKLRVQDWRMRRQAEREGDHGIDLARLLDNETRRRARERLGRELRDNVHERERRRRSGNAR